MSTTPPQPAGPYPQMIFEDVGGQPIAKLPTDGRSGAVLVPDGRALFSLDQAAVHFKLSAATLRRMYLATFGDAIAAAEAVGEAGANGGESPAAAAAFRVPPAARLELLKVVKYPDLSPEHWAYFLEVCRVRKLDPWLRHAWPESRPNPRDGKPELVILTTIDALRLIASRTGRFNGQTAPAWCDVDGNWHDAWRFDHTPVAARVGAYVKGQDHPHWGVAHTEFYIPMRLGADGAGEPAADPFWTRGDRGAHMIAKCANALALRMAFPEDTAELFIAEEIRGGPAPDASSTTSAAADDFVDSARPIAAARNDVFPLEIEEDTPATRHQMELRLVDEFGLTSPRIRAAILDRARQLHTLHESYPQLFYGKVIRELRTNPALYGLPPRPQHAA